MPVDLVATMEMSVSMDADSSIKLSESEVEFGRRIRRHFEIGVKALCIAFALSGIILANGNYLSELINIDPNSILFQLWPFNRVYLQQFASSP